MAQQYFATVYGRVYGTANSSGYTAVAESYEFSVPEQTWVIEHNLNTTRYMLDLFDTNDKKFFANVQATSESEIVINLTEAMTGRANVIFIV
jgi:lipopolysaccharide assembly outer membrane protein LptD (OstA)